MSCGQPLASTEEEDHVNNRLKHYLKRLELVTKKTNSKFSSEIQQLVDVFKHSLSQESFKEKAQLLEEYTKNMEMAEFLSTEFDKQFINEDILVEIWYLNEIMPHLDKDLYDEVVKVIKDFKEAYRADDLDTKLNIYSDIGENISEKFLDYFYGENEPVPLMNAQLKYYQEYLQYLLNECKLNAEFEQNVQELSLRVETARLSDDKAAKESVLDTFDDLSTTFGRYLDDHYVDFKMYKFGE